MRNLSCISMVASVAAAISFQLSILAVTGVWRAPPLVPAASLGSLLHVSAQQMLTLACVVAACVFVRIRAMIKSILAQFVYVDYVHAYM